MKIPRALLERLTEALCYAASMDKVELRSPTQFVERFWPTPGGEIPSFFSPGVSYPVNTGCRQGLCARGALGAPPYVSRCWLTLNASRDHPLRWREPRSLIVRRLTSLAPLAPGTSWIGTALAAW